MRFVFLNTTILTVDGDFNLRTVSLDEVRDMLGLDPDVPRLSAIGHESAAQIMSELLGEPIDVNRIQYSQHPSDIAICFKLRGRPPEGAILSRNQIEEIGYEFKVLTMR